MTDRIHSGDADPITVLLLDSHPERMRWIQRALERSGATVTAAAGPDPGLYDANTLDVVLVEPGVLRSRPAALTELQRDCPAVPIVVAPFPADDGTTALMDGVLESYVLRVLPLAQAGAALRRETRRLSGESGPHVEGEEMVLDGIRTMVEAMEKRNLLDQGQSKRVALIATALAEAMGEKDVEGVQLAAELHDIGRLGVRSAIWRNSGPLTEGELQEVRRHTSMGLQMLSPLIKEPRVLAGILWHHERWDGTGYPDGLRGEQIPRLARIVGVADALTAMTADRPHRPGRSWDEALAEVRAGKGTQFAPAVVDALDRVEPLLRRRLGIPDDAPQNAGTPG